MNDIAAVADPDVVSATEQCVVIADAHRERLQHAVNGQLSDLLSHDAKVVGHGN